MASAGVRASVGTPVSVCGLRERKKRRTRDALLSAALDLFKAKGYEHTTVREITDAVEVSERTFFRYFASKEELVLSFVVAAADAFAVELSKRPASERPVEALRNAMRTAALTLDPQDIEREQMAYALAMRLIEATPALLAAQLMVSQNLCEKLIAIMAEREGVDPATDPRPRIIATVFCGLMSAASQVWRGDGDITTMTELADGYLAELVPTFTEPWT
ncbi:MAG TPA: TetR family transcriptional regulator [Pseudonocardiaceae bacterium]|nr:TetR family transcriptional regulator [Pseudonocardiaceae bacterium]